MKKWLAFVLILSLLLTSLAPTWAEAKDNIVPLVVVYLEDESEIEALLYEGLDIVSIDSINKEIILVMHVFEKEFLERGKYKYDILVEDLNKAPVDEEFTIMGLSASYTGRTDYRNWQEHKDELHMMEELYPEIAKLHIIGESHQKEPIYALEISTALGINDGRPESVHMAAHHAREWPSNELAMDLAWYLLDNYEKNERVTAIIDAIRVWIIPMQNPDGFNHSQNAYRMWRKNRRNNNNGTWGVDTNRNYSYLWGDNAGSSGTTSSETYRGTEPFSEPENKAIRDFYLGRHIITSITGHTHGNLILYPWGYKKALIVEPQPALMGKDMASWNLYDDKPAMDLYPTNGDTVDWLYGTLRSIGFTFEYGPEFIPAYQGIASVGLDTDKYGVLEGRTFTYSVPLNNVSGNLVNCGLGLTASDFSEAVAGNIALIARGEISFRDKALNAQAAGAVGVVIYNNTTGHMSGSLSSSGVNIPVLGIQQIPGRKLAESLDKGEKIEGILRPNGIRDSYASLWKKNLPAFLYNIEKAKEYASVIEGTVTDKLTGEEVGARLDMEITFQVPLAGAFAGRWIEETQRSSIDVTGDYIWNVLPSRQPEVSSPPYRITATSPGRYSKVVELAVNNFEEVHELNFELQPYVALRNPLGEKDSWQPNATIPFKFVTLNSNGEGHWMENVKVKILIENEEIVKYQLGKGANSIRPGDEDGEYIVNINTKALGLDEGIYTIIIEFDGIEGTAIYCTKLVLSLQAKNKQEVQRIEEQKSIEEPEVIEDKDIENIEDADELKNVDEIGDVQDDEDIENAA